MWRGCAGSGGSTTRARQGRWHGRPARSGGSFDQGNSGLVSQSVAMDWIKSSKYPRARTHLGPGSDGPRRHEAQALGFRLNASGHRSWLAYGRRGIPVAGLCRFWLIGIVRSVQEENECVRLGSRSSLIRYTILARFLQALLVWWLMDTLGVPRSWETCRPSHRRHCLGMRNRTGPGPGGSWIRSRAFLIINHLLSSSLEQQTGLRKAARGWQIKAGAGKDGQDDAGVVEGEAGGRRGLDL